LSKNPDTQNMHLIADNVNDLLHIWQQKIVLICDAENINRLINVPHIRKHFKLKEFSI